MAGFPLPLLLGSPASPGLWQPPAKGVSRSQKGEEECARKLTHEDFLVIHVV